MERRTAGSSLAPISTIATDLPRILRHKSLAEYKAYNVLERNFPSTHRKARMHRHPYKWTKRFAMCTYVFFMTALAFRGTLVPHYSFPFPAPPVEIGPAARNFISELGKGGLELVPTGKVKKALPSIQGTLLTLGNDSVQVFEYPDTSAALEEGTELAQRFAKISEQNPWKKFIHLYIKDTLLIFYMGKREDIANSMTKITGVLPLVG